MKQKKTKPKKKATLRTYETEALNVQSLRLVEASKPEKDLSEDALAALYQDPSFSPELIQHLIEKIKAI